MSRWVADTTTVEHAHVLLSCSNFYKLFTKCCSAGICCVFLVQIGLSLPAFATHVKTQQKAYVVLSNWNSLEDSAEAINLKQETAACARKLDWWILIHGFCCPTLVSDLKRFRFVLVGLFAFAVLLSVSRLLWVSNGACKNALPELWHDWFCETSAFLYLLFCLPSTMLIDVL